MFLKLVNKKVDTSYKTCVQCSKMQGSILKIAGWGSWENEGKGRRRVWVS